MEESIVTTKITYVTKHYDKYHKLWHDAVNFEEIEDAKEWVMKMNRGRPNHYQIFEKIVTSVETLITAY